MKLLSGQSLTSVNSACPEIKLEPEVSQAVAPIVRAKRLGTSWRWEIGIVIIITLLVRLFTAPAFVESGDGIYFVRGVEHYAMLQLRPHRPGFPIYIWFGQLINFFTHNPSQALHWLSIAVGTFSIWPVSALASMLRQTTGGGPIQTRLAGLAAAISWALIPLSWLGGTEIYSDGLALSLAVSLLWLCFKAIQQKEQATRWLVVAAIVAGLMLGVRLTYATLLLPLVYTVWVSRAKRDHRHPHPWGFLLAPPWLAALAFIITVNSWLIWQVAQEGPQVLKVLTSHFSGSYEIYGVAGPASGLDEISSPNLALRLLILFKVVALYGVGGWWLGTPWMRLPLTGVLLWLVLIGGWRLVRSFKQVPVRLLLLWVFPYLLVSLTVTHELWISRYTFPLVAALVLVGAGGLPDRRNWRYAALTLAGLSVALLAVSLPLALAHKENPPLGYQLADYANKNLNPGRAVILISDTLPPDAFVSLFLEESAPNFTSRVVDKTTLSEQVRLLESQGYEVYLATRNDDSAEVKSWQPATELSQPPYLDALMDTSGFLKLKLYRHQVAEPFLNSSEVFTKNYSQILKGVTIQ